MTLLAFLRQHKIITRWGTLALLLVAAAVGLGIYGSITTDVSQRALRADEREAMADVPPGEARLLTVYDGAVTTTFLSKAATLGQALEENAIAVDPHDTVEPSLDEELVAPEYSVNIYHARPVMVVDGARRIRVMTPFQTADRIARDAGLTLDTEDGVALTRSDDILNDGAGLQLTIKRSVPFRLELYGRTMTIRTREATVGDMLKEKGITLGPSDRVSRSFDTPVVKNMQVRVWREGVQTLSVDQPIPFTVEKIYDADRYFGYRAVKTPGAKGLRTITYEVNIRKGKEISRKEIARIIDKAPVRQVEVVGIKSLPGALSQAKGAQYFTDSKGVSHRETYYDLNMSVVIGACQAKAGPGYTVRSDGAKVDADGYILVAANYGNYPRCSIVETSMGPGKVYDTGGFAARHPHGFDLATDWTRADGI